MSDGFLEVHAALLLAGLGLLVLGEAQVHRAAVALESALRQRQIRLLRFARREHLGESDHRLPRLAHYHHAAGFPVEPVGGAGLELAFQDHQPLPLEIGARLIDQGVAADPRPGMDGEPGRLVADQDVRVFVEHGEVLAHVAGRALCGRRRSQVGVRFPGAVDHHHVARLEQLRDVGARAVHAHLLGAHHLVEVRERHLREPAAEELVQPLPARVLRDRVLELHREGCVSWKRTTRQVPSACRASVRWASRCKSPPPCGRMSSL